jgi:ATP-dependent DNA helicase DinG
MMMVKLKQAIGRTNRHSTQESIVLVLDNRVYTKRYGHQILSFLQKDYQLTKIDEKEICGTLQQYFEE